MPYTQVTKKYIELTCTSFWELEKRIIDIFGDEAPPLLWSQTSYDLLTLRDAHQHYPSCNRELTHAYNSMKKLKVTFEEFEGSVEWVDLCLMVGTIAMVRKAIFGEL